MKYCPLTNTHEHGCGPYTPGGCCEEAAAIKAEAPEVFNAMAKHFSTEKPVLKPHKVKRKKKPAKRTKRLTKKVSDRTGEVRINSSIDRLGLPNRLAGALASSGFKKVSDLTEATREHLAVLLDTASTRKVEAALKKVGKKLAEK